MDPTQQPGIRLDRIFLNEARFSHRSDPFEPLPESMRNETGMIDMEITVGRHEDGQVSIFVRASNEPGDEQARYDFLVEMVGMFHAIPGKENMPVEEYAMMNGVALMYPFVRETVANLTSRGRFGPLWLNPANLQAILAAGEERSPDTSPTREAP